MLKYLVTTRKLTVFFFSFGSEKFLSHEWRSLSRRISLERSM